MLDDNAGSYYILNGNVAEASVAVEADLSSGRSAYEVIRVIRGIPLFYQDHYDRLASTFMTIGKPLAADTNRLKEYLKKLLEMNKSDFCNIKVIVFEKDGYQNVLSYISKSYYPSEAEADTGVRTGIFRLERSNPNAKLLNRVYKDAVSAQIKEGGYFEVLLVDSHERITEGSRSNVFFVRKDRILTAPGEHVLKGITRKYVLEACRNAGYETVEEFIETEGLSNVDGAFLSGTSIKVLPIASIDEIAVHSSVNPVVTAVRREYDLLLEKYIEANAKIW